MEKRGSQKGKLFTLISYDNTFEIQRKTLNTFHISSNERSERKNCKINHPVALRESQGKSPQNEMQKGKVKIRSGSRKLQNVFTFSCGLRVP